MNKDDAAKALEDAAFHTWLTLGEWLTFGNRRTELLQAYGALGIALENYRRDSCPHPPAAVTTFQAIGHEGRVCQACGSNVP